MRGRESTNGRDSRQLAPAWPTVATHPGHPTGQVSSSTQGQQSPYQGDTRDTRDDGHTLSPYRYTHGQGHTRHLADSFGRGRPPVHSRMPTRPHRKPATLRTVDPPPWYCLDDISALRVILIWTLARCVLFVRAPAHLLHPTDRRRNIAMAVVIGCTMLYHYRRADTVPDRLEI